ncbi:hypothetical protein E3E31_04290 [Thermococcus sp. M39]|uniref:hypothetical protein n=1 Tax=unclassified Thermococcus TaxID=2627626 RepID=UPI00143C6064|nr:MULTISPECIES: hypothetical protein [unclassified Thermococcus]NJE07749.1 hypothetical protein [Thermococcus sp. M39]NJE12304.1 hypothetical protein [Thermococcus sp. LS2]
MTKVLIIISTAEIEKALTGFMYAVNSVRYSWLEEVEVVLFGPIEREIARGNEKLMPWVEKLKELNKTPYACRKIAEDEGIVESLKPYAKVEYVGSVISKLINKGYVPMVF